MPDTSNPQSRPRIVVLCGSTRYWDALTEANLYETAAGHIVLAPGCNMKQPHPLWATTAQADRLKAMLDALHLQKIDLADEVLVVNPGGYIGESTRREIAYARSLGKPLRYTHPADHGTPATEPGTVQPAWWPQVMATVARMRRFSADLLTHTAPAFDGQTLRLEVTDPTFKEAWSASGAQTALEAALQHHGIQAAIEITDTTPE
ncbi:hypothetical protein [Streptomyces colonosanans]|uniref:hypothetical protein n=1 Tax=Streptomyces colonosanans TaxID=1428652 RepID=UPI000A6DE37F